MSDAGTSTLYAKNPVWAVMWRRDLMSTRAEELVDGAVSASPDDLGRVVARTLTTRWQQRLLLAPVWISPLLTFEVMLEMHWTPARVYL